ncbi:MAG: PQQ-binding-like beta-propeller repeat protein [Oceanipulchritudo sp.]
MKASTVVSPLPASRLKHLALAGLLAAASLSAQSTDWPAQSGPNFDYSYQAPAGVTPAKSLADIDLIWDSTAYFGSGATSREWTPSGGCATPIVYQDRVYLWWMSPDLDVDVFDPASEIRKIPEEFGSYKHLYRLLDNAVSTNNHIVCIDANTGETLWERVFPATGINQVGHKETINNHTMAAADGKVFACGSDQRIHALDALTGELLWVAKNISWQSVQEIRVDALDSGKQFKSDRMWNNHLLAVDGVVVAGDNREWGTLTGFDAQTGAKLWQLSGITYGRTNPDIWKHAGRHYLVVGDNDGFSLVDPISGQILWQHTGTGPGGMSSTVQGDTFFTNLLPGSPTEADNQGIMGCFQLSLAGPTLLWQAPQADGFPQAKNAGVFVHDGKVFLRSNYQIHVYNLADGSKITASRPPPRPPRPSRATTTCASATCPRPTSS